jgi:hypothetical protein
LTARQSALEERDKEQREQERKLSRLHSKSEEASVTHQAHCKRCVDDLTGAVCCVCLRIGV